MRALVIKTSSLGDVIHTLPAVSDAATALPGIRFDWVVEEGLAEIPAWHPAVERVIPVALRRWRRHPWAAWRSGEWGRFRRQLRQQHYDVIIDAQGLLKSALLTRMAHGPRCGLSRDAAREPVAARCYQQRHSIAKGQHAIARVRQLFAACLGYSLPSNAPDYGLGRRDFTGAAGLAGGMVFLHGTTWPTKHWPESYWVHLARAANAAGQQVLLPWGNAAERERAQRIAAACDNATVLARMDLAGLAGVLAQARVVVAVDTGLGHLAAALGTPCVTLYGATKPGLTGTVGKDQIHLCAKFACAPCLQRRCTYRGPSAVQPACYGSVTPAQVWQNVQQFIQAVDQEI